MSGLIVDHDAVLAGPQRSEAAPAGARVYEPIKLYVDRRGDMIVVALPQVKMSHPSTPQELLAMDPNKRLNIKVATQITATLEDGTTWFAGQGATEYKDAPIEVLNELNRSVGNQIVQLADKSDDFLEAARTQKAKGQTPALTT